MSLNPRQVKETPLHPNHGAGMALERCLVEYFALQVKCAGDVLRVSRYDTIKKYEKSMPTMLLERFNSKYGGSLVRFFKSHASSFIFYGDDRVALQPEFETVSILAHPDNLKVVQFLLGLLQKIGAMKEKPCSIHTVSKYLPYMDQDARCFLRERYMNSLNVFFTLNGANFGMTSADRGSVFLRRYLEVSNCVAAHLRKCLHERNAFAWSSGLALEEVLLRATRTWLPEVKEYFGDHPGADKLYAALDSYPNVFKWQRPGKVWLRKQYKMWSDKWSGAEELLATIYLTEMLKDIGATSSNPICFNYILTAVKAAPQECSTYLKHVFPSVDLIDLFHLHPDKFDVSTVNCVSLKCKTKDTEQKKPPDVLSAHYAARLLKYAPNLTPDLLRVCVESAPVSVKSFCTETVRHRLHIVLDSARSLLETGAVDGTRVVDSLTALCRSPTLGAKKGTKGRKQSTTSTGSDSPAPVSKSTSERTAQKPGQADSVKSVEKPKEASGKTSSEDALRRTSQELPAPTTASIEEQQHSTHSKAGTPATSNLSTPVASSWTLPDTAEPKDAQARANSLLEVDGAAMLGKLHRSHSLDFVSSSEFRPSKTGKPGQGDLTNSKVKESETPDAIRRTSSLVFSTGNEEIAKPANVLPTENAAAAKECNDASKLRAALCSLLGIDDGKPAEHATQQPLEKNPCSKSAEETSQGGGTDDADSVTCGPKVAYNHVYGRMEYALSRFITQLLKASPTRSEDAMSVIATVNKAFGKLPSCEVYLAVLSSDDTLKFDGKRIFYIPKDPALNP